jgi:hypothetical protein
LRRRAHRSDLELKPVLVLLQRSNNVHEGGLALHKGGRLGAELDGQLAELLLRCSLLQERSALRFVDFGQ